MAASFEKAPLKVEKQQTFDALKSVMERAMARGNEESFLKSMRSAGLRIRDFDGVLDKGVLDEKRGSGEALRLYQELPVSDRAQIREFYLSQIEEFDVKLRTRFHKLYQYY